MRDEEKNDKCSYHEPLLIKHGHLVDITQQKSADSIGKVTKDTKDKLEKDAKEVKDKLDKDVKDTKEKLEKDVKDTVTT